MIANPCCASRDDDRRHARHEPFASRGRNVAFCGLFLLIFVAFPAVGVAVEDVVIEGRVVAPPMIVQQEIPAEAFDHWLYGTGGTTVAATATEHSRLDVLLQIRIDDVERSCGTTAAQRDKLMLAGRGDIRRFFERVETVREKFEAIRHDIHRVNEVLRALRPLQAERSKGLFGVDSLYAKTLKKTLTAEQVERYVSARRERRQFALQAQIEMTTAALGNALGLRAGQREKLADLLREEVRFVVRPGAAQTQLILYQIVLVPEERLKPLFDPGQWRILNSRLNQVRQLEHVYRQSLPTLQSDADEISFSPQGDGVLPPRDGRGVNADAPAKVDRPAEEIRK